MKFLVSMLLGLACALLVECCATVLDSAPDEEIDRRAMLPVDTAK